MKGRQRTCEGKLSIFLAALDDLHHGQLKGFCKGEVPAVVGGHGHDGTAAIGPQHVVCHPDGDVLQRGRVDAVGACKSSIFLSQSCLI